jgi:hypothetical protein
MKERTPLNPFASEGRVAAGSAIPVIVFLMCCLYNFLAEGSANGLHWIKWR